VFNARTNNNRRAHNSNRMKGHLFTGPV